MRKSLMTIVRGLLLGGAFGAKAGVLVGYVSGDSWMWISYLMFAGLVLGLIISATLVLNRILDQGRRSSQTARQENLDWIQETILVK